MTVTPTDKVVDLSGDSSNEILQLEKGCRIHSSINSGGSAVDPLEKHIFHATLVQIIAHQVFWLQKSSFTLKFIKNQVMHQVN